MFCPSCGAAVGDGSKFCSKCGRPVALVSANRTSGEQVLGCVLFGGYYKDIAFTDTRVILFEPFRQRWKFLMQALGPKRLVVDRTSTMDDITPFIKMEIPRGEISRIEVKAHGTLVRGKITVLKSSGEEVYLARLDVDIEKESYADMISLVNSIYPEIPKEIS